MTSNVDVPRPELAQLDGRGSIEDQQATNISRLAHGWNGSNGTYGLDPEAKKIIGDAAGSIIMANAALRSSEEEAKRHEGNLDLHPDGRKARAADARKAGIDKANEMLSDAELGLIIGEAALISASAPSMGETQTSRFQNRQAATQDIRMVLDGTKPSELMARIGELAQVDGPIGAVITNDPTFTDLYLKSRGVNDREAQAIKDAAREYAINARAERGDRNAKAVYALRRNLKAAFGGTMASVRRNR